VKICAALTVIAGWGSLRRVARRAGTVPAGTGCAGRGVVARMGVAVR
jgi:hypothetical protein